MIIEEIADVLQDHNRKIQHLERQETINIIIKKTTGNPVSGVTGNLLINSFDNAAFIWADGGWRQVCNW